MSVATLAACSAGSAPTVDAATPAVSSVVGDVVQLSGADPEALGGGQTIKVGINVALSGQGAFYGQVMVDGAQLAADQIAAAGGPTFELVVKDNQSGDAQAGVSTTREFGQEDIHYALYSYIGVLGSAFQGIEQYKILSLDGGGGTQKFGQNKPYFYGTRAQAPNDVVPGAAQYVAEAMPEVKNVALIVGDTGADNVADTTEIATAAFEAEGISLDTVEVVQYGGSDYASAVTRLLNASPDLIFSAQFGTDTGYFLKQLRGAGSDTPVLGVDFIPDVAEIAGSAAEGYMFGADYFDADNPPNEWAKYFVDTYTVAHPDVVAESYAANYYNDMFTLWQVVQRITAEGGDVNDPETILDAFTSDTSFPSVYGVPAADAPSGVYTFDADTHSLSERPMGVFVFENSTLTEVASFDVGGRDFQLVK